MDWNLSFDFRPGVACRRDSEKHYYIVISDGEVLGADDAPGWRPIDQDEFRWLGIDVLEKHYLGELNGIPLWAVEADPDAEEPDRYTFATLYSFLSNTDEPLFNLLGRAKQIVEWHRDHQFCGECGKPTVTSDFDRSRQCPDCNHPFYPRISPSIIVLVTRGEELLLAQNARARRPFYSTLAGFVEPGESLEEAVHREVKEEVGIDICNLAYYASQAWPFPDSLMLGFHAEYAGGELRLQPEEISDARWFHYSDLPQRPGRVSIAGRLIEEYLRRLEAHRER